MIAYLDIETTGLSWHQSDITVIGMALFEGLSLRDLSPSQKSFQVKQLVGQDITVECLLATLEGVEHLYTYNGKRFDIPFIEKKLHINLRAIPHTDLMFNCWKHHLKGGLKAVERRLNIRRQLPDVNGYLAVKLWWDYINDNDQEALTTLLEYNREDVVNLHALHVKLNTLNRA